MRYIHFRDFDSAEFFKDMFTYCGLHCKNMHVSCASSYHLVDCPDCLASEDYQAHVMELALQGKVF